MKTRRAPRPATTPQEKMERRIRGWQAKRNGAYLEGVLETAARLNGMAIVRIPDGCKQLRGRIVRVKSPFDYVLACHKGTIYFDAKHTGDDKLYISSIAEHQVASMKRLQVAPNVRAGFIVYFSETKQIEFFDLKRCLLDGVNAFRSGAGIQLGQMGAQLSFEVLF